MSSVAILIPTLNEAAFIEGCLASVQAFDIPAGLRVEILVLDGGSSDGTTTIVQRVTREDPRMRLIHNPGRIQSTALNLGIRSTTAEFILRLDAHSEYPANYLRLCYETARRTGADNVGGALVTRAQGRGYGAALVQALTTHPLAIGGSTFRGDPPEGPTDTVPYGFFRRDTFARLGLFDERLLRAQDYEYNRRIGSAGGTVWLNPAIKVYYTQQPSFGAFLRKQVTREAPFNAYLWFVAPYAFAPRHAITGVFAAGIIGGVVLSFLSSWIRVAFLAVLGVYALLALVTGVQQAWRFRDARHLVAVPLGMFAYHFLHGCGVLYGLLQLALRRAPVQRVARPWPEAPVGRAWSRAGPVPADLQRA